MNTMDNKINDTKSTQNPTSDRYGSNHSSDTLGSLGSNATSVLQSYGEKAGHVASAIAHGSQRGLKASGEYLKENPIQAMAILAGTGGILGYLWGRASNRHRSQS